MFDNLTVMAAKFLQPHYFKFAIVMVRKIFSTCPQEDCSRFNTGCYVSILSLFLLSITGVIDEFRRDVKPSV